MDFKTKFNFGDKVYTIYKKHKTVFIPCEFCNGTGRIEGLNHKTRICPECYGNKGSNKNIGLNWELGDDILTIGEIRVNCRCSSISYYDTPFSNYGDQIERYEESYMCYETGIRSGTIHSSNNLFISKDEALAECIKRNIKEDEHAIR